jgi:hypothetical protein
LPSSLKVMPPSTALPFTLSHTGKAVAWHALIDAWQNMPIVALQIEKPSYPEEEQRHEGPAFSELRVVSAHTG